MIFFLFFLGIAQCFIIWAMGQAATALARRAEDEKKAAAADPPHGWPSCALIIPAAGADPTMDTALRSLLTQEYPAFQTYICLESMDDPAMAVVKKLKLEFPDLEIVIAGHATTCSQKNHNLLAGVARAGANADAYVFCDSTHVARPDFLRCLLLPIARHEVAFTTGYHAVVPGDNKTITLAYALTVFCMRVMQGMGMLTQPWGGAMAMRRAAFEHYKVASLWERNVVDDCSLAALLRQSGAHIRHCPGAILDTIAREHRHATWSAWLERQVLFLKFCMPGQWIGLGFFCALMVIPPVWCSMAVFWGILGLGGGLPPFLALLWVCLAAWTIGTWKKFLPTRVPVSRWTWAFFVSCAMFGLIYLHSLSADSITWHNIEYKVGPGGEVREIRRL